LKKRAGALALAAGASVWGLFWIPLRYLDENGIPGLWAVAFILIITSVIGIIISCFKSPRPLSNLNDLLLLGGGIGLAMTFYFAAMIFTDVVRAVFLFYLLPVWSALSARLIHGTPLSRRQFISIPLALCGLYLLLGGDGNIPLPSNLGDWFALLSGVFWGVSLTLIRGNPDLDPYSVTTSPFVWGAILAIIMALIVPHLDATQIQFSAMQTPDLSIFLITIVFGAVLLWPSMFGQVWGARYVASTTAAMLTMSEIIAALISTWLIIGSQIGAIAWIGGSLIIAAAILDFTQPSAEQK